MDVSTQSNGVDIGYSPPLSGGLGSDETQRIGIEFATGGTYKLRFEGQETAPIPYNASAAEVRAALEALAAISPGDVAVLPEGQGSYCKPRLPPRLRRGLRGRRRAGGRSALLAFAQRDPEPHRQSHRRHLAELRRPSHRTDRLQRPRQRRRLGAGGLRPYPTWRPATSRSRAVPATAPARAQYLITFVEGAYAGTNVGDLVQFPGLHGYGVTKRAGAGAGVKTETAGWGGHVGEGTLAKPAASPPDPPHRQRRRPVVHRPLP